jgi:hypothetical protein
VPVGRKFGLKLPEPAWAEDLLGRAERGKLKSNRLWADKIEILLRNPLGFIHLLGIW